MWWWARPAMRPPRWWYTSSTAPPATAGRRALCCTFCSAGVCWRPPLAARPIHHLARAVCVLQRIAADSHAAPELSVFLSRPITFPLQSFARPPDFLDTSLSISGRFPVASRALPTPSDAVPPRARLGPRRVPRTGLGGPGLSGTATQDRKKRQPIREGPDSTAKIESRLQLLDLTPHCLPAALPAARRCHPFDQERDREILFRRIAVGDFSLKRDEFDGVGPQVGPWDPRRCAAPSTLV